MRFNGSFFFARNIQRMAVAILLVTAFPKVGTFAEPTKELFRIGLSSSLFPDAKKSDAIASIEAWGDIIFSTHSMNVKTVSSIFSTTEETKRALFAGDVDLLVVKSEEFFRLEDQLDSEKLLYYSMQGRVMMEYLLLVRKDRNLENLESLRGTQFAMTEQEQAGLGGIWLETLLMKQGVLDTTGYFQSTAVFPKASRAVLGVFFGKLDACMVPRSSFETMVELNPQIGKIIQIIQTSPPMIPALMCMQKENAFLIHRELYEIVRDADQDLRGKQVLTVFGVDRLVEGTVADLASARDLVELHARLKKQLHSSEAQSQKRSE